MSVTLLDRNGNPVTVADPAEAASRFLRGELFARGAVPVVRDGQLQTVDAGELEATLRSGGQLATQEAVRERTFEDQGEQAFVEGALRGVTMGASDAAAGSWDPVLRAAARALPESIAGDVDTLAAPRDEAAGDILARQEVNPIAAGAGEAAGVLSTLAAGPGRALLPGGAALEAGVLAEGAVRGAAPGLGRRALGAGIGGAVEGAVSNVGIQQGAAGLRDEEFTGEAAAGAATTGALLGFVGGAAFEGALSPIAGSVRKAFSREAINRQLDRLALGSLDPTARDIAKMRGRSFDPEFIGRVIRDNPRLLEGLRSPEEFLDRAEEIIGQEVGPEIEAILRQIDDQGGIARLTPAELRERIMREVLDEQDTPFNEGVLRSLQGKVEAALGPERAAQLFRSLDDAADGDVELDLQKYMTPEEIDLYRVAQQQIDDAAGAQVGVDVGATLPGVRGAVPEPAAPTAGARDTLVPGTGRRPGDTLVDAERLDRTVVEGGPAFARTEPAPQRGVGAVRDTDAERQIGMLEAAAREKAGRQDLSRREILDNLDDQQRQLYEHLRNRVGEFEERAAVRARALEADAVGTGVGRRRAAAAPDTVVDDALRVEMRDISRAEARRMRRVDRLRREVEADAAARDTLPAPSSRDTLADPRAPRGPQGTRIDEPRGTPDTIVDSRGPRDTIVEENALFTREARARGDMRDARVRDAADEARARRDQAGEARQRQSLYEGIREQLEQNARERAADMRARSEGIGVLELHQMRRAIDKDLFKGKVGRLEELTPAQQALKDVRDVIDDLLTRRIRTAEETAAAGSPLAQVRDRWRFANEQYQALKIAQDLSRRQALKDAAEGLTATPSLPLPMLALLTGNPGLAVVGWLAGLGRKWVAENGRAAAAVSGTRLARMLGLHLSADAMRRSVASAAKALVSPMARHARSAARIKTLNVALSPRDFSDWLDRQQQNLPQDPEALDHTTDGAPTLGDVADVDLNVASSYAEARMRTSSLISKALVSKMQEKAYQPGGHRKLGDLMPTSERRALVDYVEALRSPRAALESIVEGRVSAAAVRGIREGYPAVYTELVMAVAQQMTARAEPLPLQQRLKLQMMFPELPQDPHAGLSSAARWQEPFLERDGGAVGGMLSSGGGGGGSGRSTPRLDDDQMTRAQQITE